MLCVNLVILFFTINAITSLVPEVSQEGLLQPFMTYSDVSLFHYHVPPEVERVTWEFAAFMDDPGCPIRDVNIMVQHGSYPVFGTYNGTFPEYIYNQRSSLHKVVTKTAYQPHESTVLPVYNPLPGSWFAAAYIPNWNEQMQQEGLIHKCRYSLGSIAMWSQREDISTLHVGALQRIRTHENLSYFRFYVPSHTWLLEINLSECSMEESRSSILTNSTPHRWCIRAASLSARSLPAYDPNGDAKNISEGGGHSFIEKHPYSDSYYYLLIYTEGETTVTISITTKECGGFLVKPLTPVLREARSIHLTSNLSHSNSYKSGTNNTHEIVTTNSTEGLSMMSEFSSNFIITEGSSNDSSDDSHECYPVLSLARIKHSRDFTDTFLVQGPEWYSTWISVRGETPVFTHMTLLPFTDIGGTLSITLHLDEILMNATSQLISVIGCVKKGRPPLLKDQELECEEELTLNTTSDSLDNIEDFLLIPFPEPDTWYLALHVTCYYKGLRSPCIIDQVMVSIDIRTQPCVYAGEQPCGKHGFCQETHRGMFFFSSCICQEGWKGWGCHDGKEAQIWSTFLSGICLLTLSNIFFLPPIFLAIKWQHYTQALLFTATMVASIFYHACDSEVFSFCIARFEILQFTDFFFSLLCFWVTVVSLGDLCSKRWTPVLHFLGVIIIAPAVQYSRTALLSFMVPMGIAILIPVSQVIRLRVFKGVWPASSKRSLVIRCSGLLLAMSGLSLFALIQTKDNYKYVHSAWHMVIAMSLLFLLPSKQHSLRRKKFEVFDQSTNFITSSGESNTQSHIGSIDMMDDADLIDVRNSIADYSSASPVFQLFNIIDADVDLLLVENVNEDEKVRPTPE